MNSQPVVIVFSVLAGLQVLTGGAVLADVIGEEAAGLIVLIVAAVQAGMSFYVSNKVTPVARVAAAVQGGRLVAGPAAGQRTGSPVQVVDERRGPADPPVH